MICELDGSCEGIEINNKGYEYCKYAYCFKEAEVTEYLKNNKVYGL